ncbi:hypothetical protein VOLCADRAFT_100703, partial [Volvox carteri f. nagariensis]
LLSYATSSNFLFTTMSESERSDVFMLFERYPVKAGDVVVRQAEPGDYFYVVESGQYDVFVQSGMDPPLLVHTYSSASGQPVLRLYAGQYFGERALLTSAKRAANVVASGRVTLLAISRSRFESALGPLQDGVSSTVEVVWGGRVGV